jgi:fluoride exporter
VSALTWTGAAGLGGFGALLRFFVDGIVSARAGRRFPLGTLMVNLSGAIVLGLLSGLALSGERMLLIGTATIGSYTTFSTWMLETQRLAEDGDVRGAWGNALISLAAGLAAAAIGRLIGRHL